jgi:hypothetical protein
MDTASQNVVMALSAIQRAENQLRSLGYRLFLDTRAHSWGQPHGVVLYGRGGGFTVGFCIWRDSTGDRAIVFEIHVTWNEVGWNVRADVDDEDNSRDEITVSLWRSAEFRTTTLDELIASLQTAVDSLISSVGNSESRRI